MNVVLIAEESAGIQALRAIQDAGSQLIGVFTSIGRSSPSGASVYKAAAEMGLRIWPAELVKNTDAGETLRSQNVDVIFNVHSLHLVDSGLLKAPRIGAFNLHPGLLPKYAGLNTVSWAIYRGEKTHGVTLHRMVPEVDAGPIAYQTVFPISEGDTALSLSARCAKEGVGLIRKLLEVAQCDPSMIPATPQDLGRREYFGKNIPESGRLSWSSPAQKIVNFVRACDYYPFRSPWGHPLTRLGETEIAVVHALRTSRNSSEIPGAIGRVDASGALVACADEWILLTKIKIGKDYLRPSAVLKTGQYLGDATADSSLIGRVSDTLTN